MKRLVALILSFVLLCPLVTVQADELLDITREFGYEVNPINRPKTSIVIDAHTGEILWQDNIDEVRDPASMSKLMALYLVYEAIAEGRMSEDTVITATASDQAISQIYEISNNKIVAGVDYTVGELITMTIVPSSNAATIMLANYVSNNDPDLFIDMMNAKSQELGMTNTTWNNASGASAISFQGYYAPTRYDREATNLTTSRDMSILAYNILNKYPAILQHTKDSVVTVKAGTPYQEVFDTYNYSLPGAAYGIEGADGLKTGSSPSAGFNCTLTVKRGEQRLIGIVMGVGDWSDQQGEYYRHPFINALVENAFSDYEYRKLLDAGEETINGQTYQLTRDFYGTLAKGSQPVFVVENGQLRLDNGLESVSPLIADTVAVETGNTNQSQSAASTTSAVQTSQSSTDWLTVLKTNWYWLLLPLLLLMLATPIVLSQRSKRLRRQRMRERAGERSRHNRF